MIYFTADTHFGHYSLKEIITVMETKEDNIEYMKGESR